MISTFDALEKYIASRDPVTLAVAGGNDEGVIGATLEAIEKKLVKKIIMTGDMDFIRPRIPGNLQNVFELHSADTPEHCSNSAVAFIRRGEANILMKGSVDTKSLLRAVVNRENGLRKGSILSNVTVAELPSYHKFLVATDNGIVSHPDLEQKKQIIRNTAGLFRGLKCSSVKVAAVMASETVSEKLVATTDAATLTSLSGTEEVSGFLIDGPFGYDVAVSNNAAQSKGLDQSSVAGDADLLLFPTIDAANAVAKSWKFHGNAKTGSIVLGAAAPILLNSRSDGAEARLNSLLLAIVETEGQML